MLDRILYALASPLAREIVDSLEREPGAWAAVRKPTTGALWWLNSKRFQMACPESLFWGSVKDGDTFFKFSPLTRLALRRAVNEWRKRHG